MDKPGKMSVQPAIPKRIDWDKVLFKINKFTGRINEKMKEVSIDWFWRSYGNTGEGKYSIVNQ